MREKTMALIRLGKKKNALQLVILALVLAAFIHGARFQGSAPVDAHGPSTSEKGLILCVGGTYSSPLPLADQDPSFDAGVTSLFAAADLGVISLAAPLENSEESRDAMGSDKASFFRHHNIGTLQISHHRMLSLGAVGLIETLHYLESRGLQTVGAGFNQDHSLAPVYITKGDTTAAVMALNANPPPGWEAARNRVGIASAAAPGLEAALEEAKDKSPLILVLISFSSMTSPREQEALARSIIDRGATLVIGTGEGPLQPVEEYNGGLIFYNIGSVSPPPHMYSYARESVLLSIAAKPGGRVTIEAVPLQLSPTSARLAGQGLVGAKILRRLGGRIWTLDTWK